MPGPLSVRQAWEVGRGKEEMSARSFESLPRVLSYQFTRESLFFLFFFCGPSDSKVQGFKPPVLPQKLDQGVPSPWASPQSGWVSLTKGQDV